MSLEQDITDRILGTFSPQEAAEVVNLFELADQSGRLARCILVAANGSLNLVKHYIEKAKIDYRDVVVAGEYDKAHRRSRDLTSSFLINEPEKMWISAFAVAMQLRGYRLTLLDTHPAAKEIRKTFIADLSEGKAIFAGDVGEISVTKANGEWTLAGDKDELELYQLNKPFRDEGQFSDAVSCYILAKQNPRGPNK